MAVERPKRLKFIGCEIIFREACGLAAACSHFVDLEFLRKGLHDLETADMRTRIQDTIDAIRPEDNYDAVLLGYARCNDGRGDTAGDTAGPRLHHDVLRFAGGL